VKEVSHYLGNTPAVCRASYIDPRVFDRYRGGVTIASALEGLALDDDAPATQGVIEEAVLALLEDPKELETVVAPRVRRVARKALAAGRTGSTAPRARRAASPRSRR